MYGSCSSPSSSWRINPFYYFGYSAHVCIHTVACIELSVGNGLFILRAPEHRWGKGILFILNFASHDNKNWPNIFPIWFRDRSQDFHFIFPSAIPPLPMYALSILSDGFFLPLHLVLCHQQRASSLDGCLKPWLVFSRQQQQQQQNSERASRLDWERTLADK